MPPLATTSVVDQQQDPSAGSIEIECTADHSYRIVCLPPETTAALDSSDIEQSPAEYYEEDDASIEITESLLEQLAFAFMDSACGQCATTLHGKCGGSKSTNNVTFSNLEIHEFNMTLGDHPSAVSGPPVALDYAQHDKQRVVDLDEYERLRTPRRKRRQLKLSYRDRKALLEKEQGFSKEQVNAAWSEALKIRQQRQETLKRGLIMMMWDDFAESTQRKCRRMVEAVGISHVV